MLFAQSCHCAANAYGKGATDTATCCKWHVGDGLVAQISNHKNANQCQWLLCSGNSICVYVWHGRKIFFYGTNFFEPAPPPPLGGVPSKKMSPLPQYQPPPPPCLPIAHGGEGCIFVSPLCSSAPHVGISFWAWAPGCYLFFEPGAQITALSQMQQVYKPYCYMGTWDRGRRWVELAQS